MYTKNCNIDNAKKVVSEYIHNTENDSQTNFQYIVNEDSLHYYIEYTPIDSFKLGGGGSFVISKRNCEIMSGKLYQ
jgi:hypothetical protein